MCIHITESTFMAEGWGCCHCPDNEPGMHTYNGVHRKFCKCCGALPCLGNCKLCGRDMLAHPDKLCNKYVYAELVH